MTAARVHRDLHLSTIHCSEPLLLQFVLSEFLPVYLEAKRLHTAAWVLANESYSEELHLAALRSLGALVGRSQEAMRLFSWSEERGVLQKLCSYAALLYSSRKGGGKEEALHRQATKGLLLGVELHEIYRALWEAPSEKRQEALQRTEGRERLFYRHIERVARHIGQVAASFPLDENVLFFLLRHREQLDALFFEGYTKKLIKEISPQTVDELEELVKRRYKRRGFQQLLPLIAEKFEELKDA